MESHTDFSLGYLKNIFSDPLPWKTPLSEYFSFPQFQQFYK